MENIATQITLQVPIDHLSLHAYADRIPPIDLRSEEYDQLARSIKELGVTQAIDALPDGRIIDGRNRFEIAKDLKLAEVPVRFLDLTEKEAVEHMLRTSVLRRNLTVTQRACIILELTAVIDAFEAEAEFHKSTMVAAERASGEVVAPSSTRTRDRIARQAGVSPRTIQSAKRVIKEAPELAKEMRAGTLTVSAAVNRITPKTKPKLSDLAKKAVDAVLMLRAELSDDGLRQMALNVDAESGIDELSALVEQVQTVGKATDLILGAISQFQVIELKKAGIGDKTKFSIPMLSGGAVVVEVDTSEVVHLCPPDGENVTPCCDKTPFELHPKSRMTLNSANVTCQGKVPDDAPNSLSGEVSKDEILA